jgi:colanic acid biosynthesis glycosyl transferase WcaI
VVVCFFFIRHRATRVAARGHQVTILTGMPSYPAGRVMAGYGGLFRREKTEGISILRACVYPTQRAERVPRLANYFSFAASSAVMGTALLREADYVMVESPPLFLGPTGWWLSLRAGARMIFNVSDLWPESAVSLGLLRRESRAFRVAADLESFCYRRAWLVTGQSHSTVADIQRRFPDVRTYHLSNGVDTSRFGPDHRSDAARRTLGSASTIVLYGGLHGLAQGLDQVLGAAEHLRHEPDVQFVLIGEGPEKAALMRAAVERGLSNVTFFPGRPFAELPSLLASADILVVPLRSEIPGAVPSKLYEAMASGRPTVLVASGEPAEIVRTHGAGIAVPPGDVAGIAQAILQLRDANAARGAGERARRAAQAHFNRDIICARFIDLLEAELAVDA